MLKNLYAILLVGILSFPCSPQETDQELITGQVQDAPVVVNASSVKGLDLPADQTVRYDEGFVSIKADCKGEVKWLVLSQFKIKYIVIDPSKTVIISVPPDVPAEGGIINVFAVGNIDGKMTDFARTNIYVSKTGPTPIPPLPPVPPGPFPPVPPPPVPPVVVGKLHVTFLVDMNSKTTDTMKMVNSETLRQGINGMGHWFRLYDIKSDIVKTKNLTDTVNKVGGNAVLVIQDENARVVSATIIPRTEQEVFDLLKKLTGK